MSEADRQLSDSNLYKTRDPDPTNEFAKKVFGAISETHKRKRYCLSDCVSTKVIMALPPTLTSQSQKK